MDVEALRTAVVELLLGGHAHAPVLTAVTGLDPRLRTRCPPGGSHSVWQLLEHIRLAQQDILEYMRDPGWKSPPFPEGYWPSQPDRDVDDALWQQSLDGFRRDLEDLVVMARDGVLDLTARIPHGEPGHSYLRELLLVADHNAYHAGQIVDVRRALGAWP